MRSSGTTSKPFPPPPLYPPSFPAAGSGYPQRLTPGRGGGGRGFPGSAAGRPAGRGRGWRRARAPPRGGGERADLPARPGESLPRSAGGSRGPVFPRGENGRRGGGGRLQPDSFRGEVKVARVGGGAEPRAAAPSPHLAACRCCARPGRGNNKRPPRARRARDPAAAPRAERGTRPPHCCCVCACVVCVCVRVCAYERAEPPGRRRAA